MKGNTHSTTYQFSEGSQVIGQFRLHSKHVKTVFKKICILLDEVHFLSYTSISFIEMFGLP